MVKVILKSIFVAFLLLAANTDRAVSQPTDIRLSFDYPYQENEKEYRHIRKFTFRLNLHNRKNLISAEKNIPLVTSGKKNPNWIKVSFIAGITVGLYTCDQRIQDFIQENRNDISDTISKFAKHFGDGRFTLPSLGVLYLYGYYFEKERARRTARQSAASFAAAGIVTQIIKFTGHRHRPGTGDPYNTWDGPGLSTSHLSFPSGHSSAAFAIATVIASEYKDNIFIPPMAYCTAAFTAFSRINDNAHWASDVFFGSALGYLIGKAIIGKNNTKNLTFSPHIARKYSVLRLSLTF